MLQSKYNLMKGNKMTSLLKIEMEAKIEEAVDKALEKFWSSIVESFPEISGGDFDPMYEGVMYQQATNWLEHWLSCNGEDLYV